jgi:hypothetical protein
MQKVVLMNHDRASAKGFIPFGRALLDACEVGIVSFRLALANASDVLDF